MFLPDFYLILFAALALGQIALAVYLFYSEKEFIKELSAALGLNSQQQKSWSLWHKTFKKTQAILGEAELEGVKIVADTKYYTRELESRYDQQYREAVAQSQQEFGKFLAGLEKDSQSIVNGAMADFAKRLEENLTQEKAQVESYRKAKLAGIDQNMAEIVDQVARVVIGKKLPESSQTDLITEALERAKQDKLVEVKPQ